jgi:cell division ATPase FtsA
MDNIGVGIDVGTTKTCTLVAGMEAEPGFLKMASRSAGMPVDAV